MGIWITALDDFKAQCDSIGECIFCTLLKCDCHNFKKGLTELARQEKELEKHDEKQ